MIVKMTVNMSAKISFWNTASKAINGLSKPVIIEWNNYIAFRYYWHLLKKRDNPLIKQWVFFCLLLVTIRGR